MLITALLKNVMTLLLRYILLPIGLCAFLVTGLKAQPVQSLGTPTVTSPGKKLAEPILGNVDPLTAICAFSTADYDWLSLSMNVRLFSTYKVETSCDTEAWEKTTLAATLAQIQTITSTHFATKSGPYYMLMDVNRTPVTTAYGFVGKLRFSQDGLIKIRLLDVFLKLAPNPQQLAVNFYTPFNVFSKSHYVWNTGTLAHRLVAPNGDHYIMFYWTTGNSPGLTRSKLIELGNYLSPPPGWRYENFLVNQTITIRAAVSTVFQNEALIDELGNRYVKYDK